MKNFLPIISSYLKPGGQYHNVNETKFVVITISLDLIKYFKLQLNKAIKSNNSSLLSKFNYYFSSRKITFSFSFFLSFSAQLDLPVVDVYHHDSKIHQMDYHLVISTYYPFHQIVHQRLKMVIQNDVHYYLHKILKVMMVVISV